MKQRYCQESWTANTDSERFGLQGSDGGKLWAVRVVGREMRWGYCARGLGRVWSAGTQGEAPGEGRLLKSQR